MARRGPQTRFRNREDYKKMKPTPKVYLVAQYFYDKKEIAIMGIFDDIKDLFRKLVCLEAQDKLDTPDYICGVARFSKNKLYDLRPKMASKKNFVWLTKDGNWDNVFSDKTLGLWSK